MDGYSQELKDEIKQAEKVKKDLENMMEGLVTVGQSIINDIDGRRLVNNETKEAEYEPGKLPADEQKRGVDVIRPHSFENRYEKQTMTDLIKCASNPADEVAEENIGLKILPDLIDIITEEAHKDVLQDAEAYGGPESVNGQETTLLREKIQSNSAAEHAESQNSSFKSNIDDRKIRVYKLAAELGIEAKDIINDTQNHKVSVKHHMNLLTRSEADKIISWFTAVKTVDGDDNIYKRPAFLDASAQPFVQKINWEELRDGGSVAHVGDETQDTEAEVFFLDKKNIVPFPIKEDLAYSDIQMEFKTESEPGQPEMRFSSPYPEVKSLSEQGYSIKEMAQLLKRSQGEIGFMLSINDKRERGVL
ncbi:MAG: translation initiation factor IF-2 N-terminal domain-containing protein [Syntrophomonadaceae bacterium]|nr:translation initiation factor IF-2 N-terminal domain-containing protein [Syntrophomonadaceae bacterium]